jgi:hypothetical protein
MEAERLLDAEFRPPVKRGDLQSIAAGRTTIIIDGEFGQNLSVSPKEILRLITRGHRVVGTASMGALRAAELSPYGMEGYGRVYQGYRSGRVSGDDEVALLFSSVDHAPLTVPLINVRFWVEDLRGRSLLDGKTARSILRSLRDVFFADRTPSEVRRILEALLGEERARSLLHASGDRIPDVKAEDAMLTLKRMAAETA